MPERADTAAVAAAIAALPGTSQPTNTRFVGIDGPGGAGKTTLAARVARLLRGCDVRVDVVHIDDFAGPQVDEWDWPRFRTQVLAPLLEGQPARYQVWDWDGDVGGEWVQVLPGGVVLVEGVSATRSEVGVPWAVTVWVETPRALRSRRAIERDGASMWPVWRDRWIPLEEAYIARENPAGRVDFVVSGTP